MTTTGGGDVVVGVFKWVTAVRMVDRWLAIGGR